MPKVKLSALVSDMKGKANGSVFSTNSGGVYFRNNPSGGGRPSKGWDTAKNKFGSLASSWKSLTPAQRTAWNDMAPNYPTTNAFGDPRVPTGYELFMRLNTRLINVGLDPLIVPTLPVEMPAIPPSAIVIDQNFYFSPSIGWQAFPTQNGRSACGSTLDCQELEVCIDGTCILDPNGGGLTTINDVSKNEDISFGCMFKLSQKDINLLEKGDSVYVLGQNAADDAFVSFFLKKDGEVDIKATFVVNLGGAVALAVSSALDIDFSQMNNIAFKWNAADNAASQIIVNRVPQVVDGTPLIPFGEGPFDVQFTPIPRLAVTYFNPTIQAAWFNAGNISKEVFFQYAYGVFTAVPSVLVDFGTSKKNTITQIGSDETVTITDFPKANNPNVQFPGIDQINSPFAPFVINGSVSNDFLYILEATPFVPYIKSSKTTTYKKVASFFVAENQAFNLGQFIQDKFGLIINDGSMRFQVRLININTGQFSEPIELTSLAIEQISPWSDSIQCTQDNECQAGEVCVGGYCISEASWDKRLDEPSVAASVKFKGGAELTKAVN